MIRRTLIAGALLLAASTAQAAQQSTYFGNVGIPNVVLVDPATGNPYAASGGSSGGSGASGSVTAAGTNGSTAQAVQGINGGVPLPVSQNTVPWIENLSQVAGTALGAPTAYGTAPTGNALGVNAAVTSLPANASFNESQIGGVAPTMGAGASGPGTQRVILSSDTQALVGDALAINQPTALLTGANQTGTITGTTAEAFVTSGKPTYTTGTVAPLNTNTSGSLRVDPTGYTGQGYLVPSAFFGITPVETTSAAALSAKTSSGALYGVSAYNATTTAGYLIEYNANATPANGATLTNTLILGCHPLPASGEKETQRGPFPKTFNAGIQILVSSTPCYGTTVTYTTGTVTAYIEAEVQ